MAIGRCLLGPRVRPPAAPLGVEGRGEVAAIGATALTGSVAAAAAGIGENDEIAGLLTAAAIEAEGSEEIAAAGVTAPAGSAEMDKDNKINGSHALKSS